MHDYMQYDVIQGQGHKPDKVSKPFIFSSAIYYGSWQLTTDSLTRAKYLNLIGPDFWYFS